jgi:hypothetical protein
MPHKRDSSPEGQALSQAFGQVWLLPALKNPVVFFARLFQKSREDTAAGNMYKQDCGRHTLKLKGHNDSGGQGIYRRGQNGPLRVKAFCSALRFFNGGNVIRIKYLHNNSQIWSFYT